ncbi:HlyD family type I secretion periplasmic adaptor subunit [Thermodesulfobacteriota bacterium B35]
MTEHKTDTRSRPERRQKSRPGLFRRLPAADPDLATDIRSAILAQSPRGGRLILWLVFFLVLFSICWAATSEIEVVTRGMGRVVPSRQVQVVQNLEGGILAEILVEVGDVVEQGQLLLRIDQTRFSAPYRESRARYLALLAKTARLEAEIHDTPFTVPDEVAGEKPEIGRREEELYNSRKQELAASLDVLEQQFRQHKQDLAEKEARLAELTRTYRLLEKELQMTTPLVADGAVSEVELLRLQRQASQMKGEIDTTRLAIPRLRYRMTESRQAQKETRLAFFNKAKAELADAYAELESLSATAVALEDRLERTQVRSPVRGTVNRVLVNTVGGIIRPGMDLVEIVPLEDTLLVETRIRPADIAFLRPGQPAMVKFTAYDFTIYGGLKAKLEHISADSIADDKDNSFYLVRVRTERNFLGSTTHPLPIIPGMVASVDILTGKRTILSYLLKPVLRARKIALRER